MLDSSLWRTPGEPRSETNKQLQSVRPLCYTSTKSDLCSFWNGKTGYLRVWSEIVSTDEMSNVSCSGPRLGNILVHYGENNELKHIE